MQNKGRHRSVTDWYSIIIRRKLSKFIRFEFISIVYNQFMRSFSYILSALNYSPFPPEIMFSIVLLVYILIHISLHHIKIITLSTGVKPIQIAVIKQCDKTNCCTRYRNKESVLYKRQIFKTNKNLQLKSTAHTHSHNVSRYASTIQNKNQKQKTKTFHSR